MAGRVTRLRERVARADAPREALGAAAFASALANRPVDEVAALARRALGPEARPPRPGELPWFQQSAVALVWADRLDEARSHLDAAVAGARATGDGMLFAAAVSQRAQLALRAGDLDAAEADARTALEAADLPVPMLHRLLAVGVLAAVLVDRGAPDEADAAISAVAPVVGETLPATAVAFQRGRVRLAQHRTEEGLAELLAVGGAAGRLAVPSPTYLPWRSEAALAGLALGHRGEAARLAEEEVALARDAGSARALGIALRAEGLVAGGERGVALLREGAGLLAAAGARLEHARALADLGAALRRANRRAEARDPLRQALDLAHRIGAHAIADRAETELRAAGAKPRRAALRGAESLTASERRVAELAATGMTNREIAQALFVTARTVEGHLTHVFAKLGVTSRAAVAGALA
jgi:ATP/maltotriose-dependent transcriptional regulator MalT